MIMGISIYFGWPHGSKHKLVLLCQWLPIIGPAFAIYCHKKDYEHNLIEDYPATSLYHIGAWMAVYTLYIMNFVAVYEKAL